MVFGVPIDEAAKISDKERGLLPAPVRVTTQWLQQHGRRTEYLYRMSGSVQRVKQYVHRFNAGEFTIPATEAPETVTSLLLYFFSSLPTPLLPPSLTDLALPGENLDFVQRHLNELSEPSNETAKTFYRHLLFISQQPDVKMSAEDLAQVAPNQGVSSPSVGDFRWSRLRLGRDPDPELRKVLAGNPTVWRAS